MRDTPKYLLIEHRIGQPLDKVLREYRDAKLSAPAMARLIEQKTGIRLSLPTVRLWVRDLDAA